MASRDKVRPTPPPCGPALVRPTVGVLLLALGGAADAGCTKKHTVPPMPNATYDDPPMAQPDEPPPEEAPPQEAPMPEPDEPVPPMPPPPMPPPK